MGNKYAGMYIECSQLCTSVHKWRIELDFYVQNVHLVCHRDTVFLRLVDRKLHSGEA